MGCKCDSPRDIYGSLFATRMLVDSICGLMVFYNPTGISECRMQLYLEPVSRNSANRVL